MENPHPKAAAAWFALGLSVVIVGTPVAARTLKDDAVKLSGCLVKGDGDGNPFLLTNSPAVPALAPPDANIRPTGVGTTGEFTTVFYWLDGDDDLKDHVGHQVEIEGDVKAVKDGQIEMDRKDNWTELTVKADGREMKARVPHQSVLGLSRKDDDRKGRVEVRHVDVEHIRMLSAACEP